jgi:hypothetical protein
LLLAQPLLLLFVRSDALPQGCCGLGQ